MPPGGGCSDDSLRIWQESDETQRNHLRLLAKSHLDSSPIGWVHHIGRVGLNWTQYRLRKGFKISGYPGELTLQYTVYYDNTRRWEDPTKDEVQQSLMDALAEAAEWLRKVPLSD